MQYWYIKIPSMQYFLDCTEGMIVGRIFSQQESVLPILVVTYFTKNFLPLTM